jgi:hypothetical protein
MVDHLAKIRDPRKRGRRDRDGGTGRGCLRDDGERQRCGATSNGSRGSVHGP